MANSSKSYSLFNSRFTSIVSIALVIFLIGALTVLLLLAGEIGTAVRENLTLSVVLNDNLKEVDIQKMVKTIDASDYAKNTQYISKDDAVKELTEELGSNPVEFLGFNPLNSSVELNLNSQYANSDSIAWIETELKRMPEVKEVVYQRNLIDAVNKNIANLSMVLLCLSAVLLLISYALISNTVRLWIYAKRFLIRTMQLVGATKSFIRKPFILKGLASGVISSCIAIGALTAVLYYTQKEVYNIFTYETIDSLLIAYGVMMLSGIIITMIATRILVNRYLRLSLDQLNNE